MISETKDIRKWSEWGKYQVAAETLKTQEQLGAIKEAREQMLGPEQVILDHEVERLTQDIRGLGAVYGLEILAKLLIYIDLRGGE